MSFLKNMLAGESAEINKDWTTLKDTDSLTNLIEESYQKPVVIFKHSIRCGISSMIKSQLEQGWNFNKEELHFFYLDLINNRSISNKIAENFKVTHQSPQLILLKDGKAVFNTSHHQISVASIKDNL